MKNILFPTDFSENSMQAFPYALDIAFLFDAHLTLFNAYKLPHSKSNLLVSIVERMKEDSEKELNKLREKALEKPKYKKLSISVDARAGSLVSLIPKLAVDCSSNLIVMGTKGADSIKEVLIGSNTLEVIQTTKCPVLAIPRNAHNNPISKIAMATDFKKVKDYKQLIPLFEMARICKASIEFVNVIQPNESIDEKERSESVTKLMDMAGDITTSIHFVTNKDIIDGLSDYLGNSNAGMLAMLSRKHTLFERIFTKSITHKLSFRTEIPLLVMDE